MKLWVSGGQCDDYYECIEGSKCNACELRFKCYTHKRFMSKNHPGSGDLDDHEFYIFLQMSKKGVKLDGRATVL